LLDNSLCISSIQRGKDWSLSHSCIPSLPYGHFFKVQTQPCVRYWVCFTTKEEGLEKVPTSSNSICQLLSYVLRLVTIESIMH
jgi:hypothetical protein